MRRGSRRALVGLLSVGAILLPAAGIAYLGAVSYQADRGIVAGKIDEQIRAARQAAADVEGEVDRALAGALARFGEAGASAPPRAALAALRAAHPLALRPFHVSADGRLRYPLDAPLEDAPDDGADPIAVPRTCPEAGFDDCVRAIRAARRRARQLEAVRQRDFGACAAAAAECRPSPRDAAEARRGYTALAAWDDTGPAALLGLARLDLAAGDQAAAAARYGELARRFAGRRDPDGLAYDLLADLGAAELAGDAAALLAVYRQLVGRRYRAPAAALAVIAQRLRGALAARPLAADVLGELAELDERLAEAHEAARFAAELAGEIQDVLRTAADQPRGRPALRHPNRTLVFRRTPGGGAVGLVLDPAQLGEAAARSGRALAGRLPAGTRAVIQRPGEGSAAGGELRTLASAGFGIALPHLTLALVNDRSMPDPLDAIVQARGRRHLLLTGGLVALLVAGLVATMRGAARERELARLKSDFVSTVSHERKTPLTSIRMFAEMLQEGVAGGDRERERRYHAIIVRESQRLGLLIANVLDYSQIERGQRRYVQKRERAREVAEEAVETFRALREGEDHEVAFAVAPEADAADVAIDREVIVQSLLNLLANAAKYGGRDHPIEVAVGLRDGDRIGLAVRDRGPGIPAAQQEAIFREFYRAPEAYQAGVEGTGLGLALVKRHVEAQGGQVVLDSALGRGSTFTIVLPRVV